MAQGSSDKVSVLAPFVFAFEEVAHLVGRSLGPWDGAS